MGFWGTLGKVAGAVAPFIPIPGAGLASKVLGTAAKAAPGVMGAFGGGGGGGGGTGDALSQSANMLGTEGKGLLESGKSEVDKSRALFDPITERNQRLMSGDIGEIMSELAPETDAIGQQFENVRSMISTQPRGGGKTSTLAQLPIEQIRILSQLVSGERSKAADTQAGVAGRLLTSGETERGQGLQSIESGGNLMLGKGSQDIARRGQNIDIGTKIAETIAELGFLLKGNPNKPPGMPDFTGYPTAGQRPGEPAMPGGVPLNSRADPGRMLKDLF